MRVAVLGGWTLALMLTACRTGYSPRFGCGAPKLSVRQVIITQGIQDAHNWTVRVQNRPTLVRVVLDADERARVLGLLRARPGGTTEFVHARRAVTVDPASNLTNSERREQDDGVLEFWLPEDWLGDERQALELQLFDAKRGCRTRCDDCELGHVDFEEPTRLYLTAYDFQYNPGQESCQLTDELRSTRSQCLGPSRHDADSVHSWLERAFPLSRLTWTSSLATARESAPTRPVDLRCRDFERRVAKRWCEADPHALPNPHSACHGINAYLMDVRHLSSTAIQPGGTCNPNHVYLGLFVPDPNAAAGCAIIGQRVGAAWANGWAWTTDGRQTVDAHFGRYRDGTRTVASWYAGHEIGHALGLYHPFDDGLPPWDEHHFLRADEDHLGFDRGSAVAMAPERVIGAHVDDGVRVRDIMSNSGPPHWVRPDTYEDLYDILVGGQTAQTPCPAWSPGSVTMQVVAGVSGSTRDAQMSVLPHPVGAVQTASVSDLVLRVTRAPPSGPASQTDHLVPTYDVSDVPGGAEVGIVRVAVPRDATRVELWDTTSASPNPVSARDLDPAPIAKYTVEWNASANTLTWPAGLDMLHVIDVARSGEKRLNVVGMRSSERDDDPSDPGHSWKLPDRFPPRVWMRVRAIRDLHIALSEPFRVGENASVSVVEATDLRAVTDWVPRPLIVGDPTDLTGRGEWGGLILSGFGRTSLASGPSNEATSDLAPQGQPRFAGDIDADGSGTLENVIIAETGGPLKPATKPAALTLEAVGSGTVLDRIQIIGAAHNCLETVGGTARVRRIACSGPSRAGIVHGGGYRGDNQFVIVRLGDDHGWMGIDVHGDGSPSATPRTEPRMANVTVLGRTGPLSEGTIAARHRDRTSGSFFRVVYQDDPLVAGAFSLGCLDLDDGVGTHFRYRDAAFNCTPDWKHDDTDAGAVAGSFQQDAFDAGRISFLPGAGASVNAALAVDSAMPAPMEPLPSGFELAPHYGAVRPGSPSPWWRGWTYVDAKVDGSLPGGGTFHPLQKEIENGSLTPSPGHECTTMHPDFRNGDFVEVFGKLFPVCVIDRDIDVDVFLSNDHVYLLADYVRVGTGHVPLGGGSPSTAPTLSIAPGAQIYAAKGTPSALVITRGARILAGGAEELPIIFGAVEVNRNAVTAAMAGP